MQRRHQLAVVAAALGLALPSLAITRPAAASKDLPTVAVAITAAASPDTLGFGRTVSVADFDGDGTDDLAVAASASRVNGFGRAGEVFVYLGGRSFDTAPDLRLVSPRPEALAEYGRFLTSGDLNGDRYGDLLVPSFRADRDGLRNVGEVNVYFGGKTIDTAPDVVLHMPVSEVSAQFGASVAVGDVNGDKIGDAIVGAHLADGGGLHDAGAAYVFYGSRTFDNDADLTVISASPETYPESGAEFGRDIAITDLNGDRHKDAIVGSAWARSGDTVWAGKAEVFAGGRSLAPQSSEVLQEPTPNRAHIYGWSLAGGADMNGDGIDDLAVGAPRADQITGADHRGDTAGTEGRVYIEFGGRNRRAPLLIMEPRPQVGAAFGRDDMTLDDLNRDGYADLAAAAPYADIGDAANAGRLHVFLGGRQLDTTADLTLTAPNPATGDLFGSSTASGRLSKHGEQLAVGAPGRDGGRGAVYVFGLR